MEIAQLIVDAYIPLINQKGGRFNLDDLPYFAEDVYLNLVEHSLKIRKQSKSYQSALLQLHGPIVLIGDLHGNIEDLIRIFHLFGVPPQKKYLFLGDYVDRGEYSLNVISLLVAFQILYPENIFLIRGNHEFQHINFTYGFYDEIYCLFESADVWTSFQTFFSWLPIAAIINNKIFCVHGGLSPLLTSLSPLEEIKLPVESYDSYPIIKDLVWSDPSNICDDFIPNHRGSGVFFGPASTESFLQQNNLKLIIRGHQCVASGYSSSFQGLVLTLFSSSNYCSFSHNKCGGLNVGAKNRIEVYSFASDEFLSKRPKTIMLLGANYLGARKITKLDDLKQDKEEQNQNNNNNNSISFQNSLSKKINPITPAIFKPLPSPKKVPVVKYTNITLPQIESK